MFAHRKVWRDAMQLVSDGILPTPLLRTHILPMEELERALELREEVSEDVIHVVVANRWAEEERLAGEVFQGE